MICLVSVYCLFVFLRIRRPPRSTRTDTLFPYTTLFRSGVRFPTTLSGSRTVAGTFDPAVLSVTDAEGTTLRDALTAFGCAPDAIADEARPRDRIAAFVAVHTEQGPVLQSEDLPVGTVTPINTASPFATPDAGTAGHASTLPMPLQRAARAGAGELH